MSSQLQILANEIEDLVNKGETSLEQGSPLFEKRCEALIILEATFDKSFELKAFRKCTVSTMARTLRHLSEQEERHNSNRGNQSLTFNIQQSQTQITTVTTEITLQILLNIEHSSLTEPEKEGAKQLLEEVKNEVTKPQTNWEKVTNLLKKSFDYGLKIAPEIVKLADAYYQAKGGA